MSLFKKKRGNRRISRGHVLDVKLRSGQVRSSRIRLGAISFGLLFATVFGLYVMWRAGEWVLKRMVYENPSFAIHQIDIRTDGSISPDQLRRWARVREGANLFALDLATVKRDLEMVPLIRTVAVERILPGTLRIRVTERLPVAQVNVPQSSATGRLVVNVFQLDREGCVMLPLDPRQRTTALLEAESPLPVLYGVKLSDLQPGRCVNAPQVQAALQLIDAFACSPMVGLVDLKSIDVASPQVLVVSTGRGSEITFAANDFERQLARWREIHDFGARMRRQIATLDLAVTNNIPARWMEAGTGMSSPPRSPQPPSHRRRNV